MVPPVYLPQDVRSVSMSPFVNVLNMASSARVTASLFVRTVCVEDTTAFDVNKRCSVVWPSLLILLELCQS